MKAAPALGAVFVTLASALPAALGPSYGGELTVGVATLPGSLQPAQPADASQRLVLGLVHETLVALDEGGRMGPSLARRWELSASRREWRFELEGDARFHDDAALSSADVLRSLQRFLDGDTAEASALRAALQPEGLLAPDPGHVVLRFREPQQGGVPALASPAAAIVSAAGAGAGPFLPTLTVPEKRLALTAFADHVRGRPYLERLTLLAQPDAARRAADLASRRLDVVLDAGPALRFQPARHATLVLVLDRGQPEAVVAALTAAAAAADLAAFLDGAQPVAEAGAAGAARLDGLALPLLVANDVPPAASQRLAAVIEALGARVCLEVRPPAEVQRSAAPLRLLLAAEGSAETPAFGVPLARLPIRVAARHGVHGLRLAQDTRLVLEGAWVEP